MWWVIIKIKSNPSPPLAEQLRPQNFSAVIGQQHLLGEGKPLRTAIETGKPHSMILWGPPGVGKTTLARLMAKAFDADFIPLSAVLAGVKDIREAISRAEANLALHRATILFVDEIHRFNKAQQDAFLHDVESGLITFIGATTENPSFELNNALLSRAQVYVLEPLTEAELEQLFNRTQHQVFQTLEFTPAARELLVAYADGDARRLLNSLEHLQTAAHAQQLTQIDEAWINHTLARQLRRFDKGGEAFYDQISALHKSVRGSNPDAALYWLTRMLDGGADPRYLARRLIRMAVEDIGLADPRALQMTLDAAQTYERLGSPEGELALVQAAIYLAVAAKSNAVYQAYKAAKKWVTEDASRPVPLHLRNAPTHLMRELDYGKNYRYAHNENDAYAAGETYLPEGMPTLTWYEPTERGLEKQIKEKLAHLAKLDQEKSE